ncbi:hypothetical protein [Barnesiella intestinihominis]|uniref:hypothetical protein n=1 Tax=Barnesiella intestinihominis TaxID=487174 RepID=UPI003AB29187
MVVTSVLVVSVLSGDESFSDGEEVAVAHTGYLKTGYVGDNLDSVRIGEGKSLRLLARQGRNFWAETLDGSCRGFIAANVVGDQAPSFSLPKRRALSSYFITREKFEALMTDTTSTLGSLQNDYIRAEYLKPQGRKMVGEFGFYVVDSVGRELRPIITFNPDGTVSDYSLEHWRNKRAAGAFLGRLVDYASPLISTREFQSFSPFDNVVTNILWTCLIGYIPMFLLVILLWTRLPLVWAPNWAVNGLLGVLLIAGPATWCALLLVQGVIWWSVVPATVVIVLLGALLFWMLYGGLRCPHCKKLMNHEFKDQQKGLPFERVRRGSREIGRRNEKNYIGGWQYRKIKTGNSYSTQSYRVGRFTDLVTYEDYVETSMVRRITNHFVCPACGHGKEEMKEEILSHEVQIVGRHTAKETYTKEVDHSIG